MLSLLEHHIKNQLDMLNYMYTNQSILVKEKKISEYLNLSYETTRNYLYQLFNEANISEPLKPFLITNEEYKKIYEQTVSKSINLAILKELILSPGHSAHYYCDTLAISPPLFAKRIRQLNNFLSRYSLKIKVKKGYRIFGQNEDQFCFFLTTCIYAFHTEIFIGPIEYTEIVTLLKKYQCPCSFGTLGGFWNEQFFACVFLVYLLRETQSSELLHSEVLPNNKLLPKDDFLMLKKLFPKLTPLAIVTAIDKFKKFMTVRISNEITCGVTKVVQTHFNWSKKELSNTSKQKIITLLSVSVVFFKRCPFTSKNFNPELCIFIDEIKKQNPRLFYSIQTLIHKIDTEFDLQTIKVFEATFYRLLAEVGVAHLIPKLTILVTTELGQEHGHYLARQLAGLLEFSNIPNEITVIELDQLKHIDAKNEYDFSLSTIKTENSATILIPYNLTLQNSSHLIKLFSQADCSS